MVGFGWIRLGPPSPGGFGAAGKLLGFGRIYSDLVGYVDLPTSLSSVALRFPPHSTCSGGAPNGGQK